MNNKSSIYPEKKILPSVFITLSLSLLSGLTHWLAPELTIFNQINLLMHMSIGLIACAITPIYCYLHFKRIIGSRKPLVNLSGMFAGFISIGYLIVSIDILFRGHSETYTLAFEIHKWGAITIFITIALHLIAFRFIQYKKQKNNSFITIESPNNLLKNPLTIYTLYFSFIALASMAINLSLQSTPYTPTPGGYETPYGEHPFRPSQTETPYSKFVNQDFIANSHTCIECHQDISKQWLSSTHRLAAADPTYVTNISLLAKKKGIAATRYCEGCHAPVALLTGELTDGGKHGGINNTPANHEGVSCVSCHRATKAVHLDGVASYHFKPQQPYLFDNTDNSLLSSINHLLINSHARPHKDDMAQSFTKEPASCATCHSQFMDKEMNDWGWVKMQDEYRAWLSSPFSKQGDPTFGGQKAQRCQDCHMPLVKAEDPSADRDGMVRSHRFAAANTMLPFLNGDQEQLKETIRFLQSNKMHISIEKPNREDAIQSTLNIQESLRQHSETPFYFYLNEKAKINISVSNTGVGHNFPGGTTDINQAWIAVSVFDAAGDIIYQSGEIQDNEILDPSSHIYQSIPIDRYGNHVWKHDLFNMVGRTYKNIIEAGDTDLITYEFVIPPWAKGPMTLSATLRYRKLNTRYAKWALKDLYTPLPIVDMARDTLVIDIIKEPTSKNIK